MREDSGICPKTDLVREALDESLSSQPFVTIGGFIFLVLLMEVQRLSA